MDDQEPRKTSPAKTISQNNISKIDKPASGELMLVDSKGNITNLQYDELDSNPKPTISDAQKIESQGKSNANADEGSQKRDSKGSLPSLQRNYSKTKLPNTSSQKTDTNLHSVRVSQVSQGETKSMKVESKSEDANVVMENIENDVKHPSSSLQRASSKQSMGAVKRLSSQKLQTIARHPSQRVEEGTKPNSAVAQISESVKLTNPPGTILKKSESTSQKTECASKLLVTIKESETKRNRQCKSKIPSIIVLKENSSSSRIDKNGNFDRESTKNYIETVVKPSTSLESQAEKENMDQSVAKSAAQKPNDIRSIPIHFTRMCIFDDDFIDMRDNIRADMQKMDEEIEKISSTLRYLYEIEKVKPAKNRSRSGRGPKSGSDQGSSSQVAIALPKSELERIKTPANFPCVSSNCGSVQKGSACKAASDVKISAKSGREQESGLKVINKSGSGSKPGNKVVITSKIGNEEKKSSKIGCEVKITSKADSEERNISKYVIEEKNTTKVRIEENFTSENDNKYMTLKVGGEKIPISEVKYADLITSKVDSDENVGTRTANKKQTINVDIQINSKLSDQISVANPARGKIGGEKTNTNENMASKVNNNPKVSSEDKFTSKVSSQEKIIFQVCGEDKIISKVSSKEKNISEVAIGEKKSLKVETTKAIAKDNTASKEDSKTTVKTNIYSTTNIGTTPNSREATASKPLQILGCNVVEQNNTQTNADKTISPRSNSKGNINEELHNARKKSSEHKSDPKHGSKTGSTLILLMASGSKPKIVSKDSTKFNYNLYTDKIKRKVSKLSNAINIASTRPTLGSESTSSKQLDSEQINKEKTTSSSLEPKSNLKQRPPPDKSKTISISYSTVFQSCPLVHTIDEDNKILKLQFDVSHFYPEEVSVIVVDKKRLVISARHEEITDGRSFIQSYKRELFIPEVEEPDVIIPCLFREGILSVETPIPKKNEPVEEEVSSYRAPISGESCVYTDVDVKEPLKVSERDATSKTTSTEGDLSNCNDKEVIVSKVSKISAKLIEEIEVDEISAQQNHL